MSVSLLYICLSLSPYLGSYSTALQPRISRTAGGSNRLRVRKEFCILSTSDYVRGWRYMSEMAQLDDVLQSR